MVALERSAHGSPRRPAKGTSGGGFGFAFAFPFLFFFFVFCGGTDDDDDDDDEVNDDEVDELTVAVDPVDDDPDPVVDRVRLPLPPSEDDPVAATASAINTSECDACADTYQQSNKGKRKSGWGGRDVVAMQPFVAPREQLT